MLPPAPGLLSITTDWPQISARRLPIRRAVMSVEPPGVNGTTMCTGFVGHVALNAPDGRMAGAVKADAGSFRNRRRGGIRQTSLEPSPDLLGPYRYGESVRSCAAEIKTAMAPASLCLPYRRP